MRIAILGWGSLLWDRRPEFDDQHGHWAEDGPRLKIEFSRISKSRQGALTLVLDEAGVETTVAWCLSHRMTIKEAICDLAKREQTHCNNVGYVCVEKADHSPNATANSIASWAQERNFDAVIWTALTSNFSKEQRQTYTVESAVNYLRELPPDAKREAAKYIRRSPQFVKLPLRTTLEAEPWFQELSTD